MKMRRSLFTSVPLSVFFALTVGVAPAGAQMTVMSSSTTFTSTSSSTSTTTTAALVTIKGTVTGSPESVAFSGQAKVNASVVTDPDFGATPTVVLTVDLSGISGIGSVTGSKYVTSDRQIVDRKLASADAVQLPFPFYQSGTSFMRARVGKASFNLSFDVNSLKLTGASGSIGSP